MFDQILSTLKSQAMPQLMEKLGLDENQAGGSVVAATDSVKEVLGGGDGFGMDDAMSLFSNSQNSSGADGLLQKIGGVLQGKLTGQVGLDAGKAGGVSAMLIPMITELVTKQLGGDSKGLASLLGGGDGIAGAAKGMLGKLFS